jgi:hypothetical protein
MSDIIDLDQPISCFPPKTVLVITESEAPSMCREFDPNPDTTYSTFFLVNLAAGTCKEIKKDSARILYNSPLGRALSRRDRITFWRALKSWETTGELVR